jgi:hypothetical protein
MSEPENKYPVRIILQTKNAGELLAKAIKFGATEICQ